MNAMGLRDIPKTALLARLPLFKDLDGAALYRLASEALRHRLKRCEVLFRVGELAIGIHLVVVRRWQALIPRIQDAQVQADLAVILEAHTRNIERVEARTSAGHGVERN